jgi:hypothetical protein
LCGVLIAVDFVCLDDDEQFAFQSPEDGQQLVMSDVGHRLEPKMTTTVRISERVGTTAGARDIVQQREVRAVPARGHGCGVWVWE